MWVQFSPLTKIDRTYAGGAKKEQTLRAQVNGPKTDWAALPIHVHEVRATFTIKRIQVDGSNSTRLCLD
jgi:hypothetical protein